MTLRRNTINIYDYPEHLNPFREGADENTEKSNTTGRRRSSFRVNAWNVFSSNKGKSKASEDVDRASSNAAIRFMTWTPKLLRKSSFRQSARSTATESLSPRENQSPTSLRLSFRSTASQRMVTPTSSRSSLQCSAWPSSPHSSISRASIAPNDSPSGRFTSPPSRPAPPNVRTSLPPSKSLLAPTAAAAHCTEIAPNNTTTGSKQTTQLLSVCKTLFPASPSEKIVGEQTPKGDTKYIQQGAKPKKKRRAPAPPVSSPGKSISDNQVNLSESDASMTSSITSSSAEDPPPYDQSAVATSDLEVISQGPELDSKNRESDSPGCKGPEQANRNSESRVPEHHFENRAELPDTLKNTEKQPRGPVETHVSEHSESGNETSSGKYIFRKDGDATVVDHEAMKHPNREDNLSSKSEDGNLKLRSTFGKGNLPEDGHPSCQQGSKIHQKESSPGIESRIDRKQSDDGVRNTENSTNIPESFTDNTYRLQNGKSCYTKDADMQNEGKLYTDNLKQTAQLTPKPKPRTILTSMTKN